MARLIEQLTENKIRTITECGLHADGRGLYLQLRPGGARSRIFRFTLKGRTRDMGLGSLAEVGLIRARAKATEQRALIAQGVDPIEHAKSIRSGAAVLVAASEGPTFEECAEAYMVERLKRCRNEVHRNQWRSTLRSVHRHRGRRSSASCATTRDI
jgi:hypothetical protein